MLKILTNPWLVRVPGFIAFAVLVHVAGPLLAFGNVRPLESAVVRWSLIALVGAVWLGRHFYKVHKAKRAQAQMVDELTKAAPAEPDASVEELATLKTRFEEALAVLKKSRGGKANIYELPWYIIIGPPGAGKTTALVNSGLHFPLNDRFGAEAIAGIGGTRNCDWWFTDEAVLIDTAGRYTTQDSDAKVDKSAWLGFLDLLKKYRKRRPINGTFVAISLADLMTQSETERRAHAAAIRERITELDKHFGIRFPVYVLLTKADLVAGFSEFFDDLGKTERQQVFGFTFPYADKGPSPVAQFDAELDTLVRRLNERLLARVSQEPDIGRRALIHGFPKQLAQLKENVGAFLREIFTESRYADAPLLRGAYFTSGTQEGTPIDRLMGTLARTFRLDAHAVAAPRGAGKSYFIADVLAKVAFQESGLAGTNRRVELQRAWLQRGAYVGAAGLAVALIAAWTFAYFRNSAYVESVATATGTAERELAAVDQRNNDVRAVLPALDAVRNLPGGFADRLEGGNWLGVGLSQTDKLGDQAVASYRRVLRELFLPRVMTRLENQLRGGGPSSDYTYEALKAYLMLDSREHYDPAAIMAFVREDWTLALGRSASTAERAALDAHLDALFAERPSPLPIPLDAAVVDAARREVRAVPLDERIYGRLKRSFSGDIPGFNVREAAGGPAAELVFVRKSGKPLAEPLPGLFTKAGYTQVFKEQSQSLTNDLAAEAWILGEDQVIDAAGREQLLAQVRERYLREFSDLYSELLLDVTLAPFASPDEAARLFSLLSRAEDSPLLKLLQAVSRQTALDEPDGEPGAVARAGDRVAQVQERLQRILGTSSAAPQSLTDMLVRNAVEERFRELNSLVRPAADGAPRPVDHLLGLLGELYQYLSVVASEAAGGAIPPHVQQEGQRVLQQLRTQAAAQPNLLVGELLNVAAGRTSALTTGGLRAYLNDLWQSGPLPVCRQAIAGRYPIARNASEAIQLDDFGQFFGYGGVMDTFFNTNLRQYVDSASSPWRTRATGNVPIQLSTAALQAFEIADAIKRAFFRQGSMQPSVAFDLRVREMDPTLGRFLIDLEGTVATYEFGPINTTAMQWPGPNPGSGVRLEFRDRANGATAMDRVTGPWAFFQLLDRSELEQGGTAEQFTVKFSNAGRDVEYVLTARSAFNPFALPQLERFQCPASL